MRASILSFAASALLAAALPAWPATIVSSPQASSASGGGNSFTPVFNRDGRFVTFVSQAKNLAPNATPSPYLDVFLRDLVTLETSLVSVNASGSSGGDADSNFPTVSTNGQFVAFESAAGNLTGFDTNGVNDVFVRDRLAGTTTLVSVNAAGERSGNGASSTLLLSADGRRVVFESTATNLVANDSNGATNDLFVRDLLSGTTALVSVDAAGAGSARGPADSASLSLDGRYVAFRLRATNGPAGATNVLGEILVRDLETGESRRASGDAAVRLEGSGIPWAAFQPVLSADGRFVVYQARETAGGNFAGTALLLRYDVQLGTGTLLVSNVLNTTRPSVSADGRLVAYETSGGLRVADVEAGTTEIVCDRSAGPGSGLPACRAPVLSADGRRVAFLGGASTNGPWAAYVYDLDTGSNHLASVSGTSAPAEVVPVSLPALSADGRRMAFESVSPAITPGDFNESADVFVRDVAAGETALVSARHPELRAQTGAKMSVLEPGGVSEFGQQVAFASAANFLTGDDRSPYQNVFVRDMRTGANQLLRDPAAHLSASNTLAFRPLLSVDGRYAAWVEQTVPHNVFASPSDTNLVWLDRARGTATSLWFSGTGLGSADFSGPALSADGRWLAFASRPAAGGLAHIYRRDMLAPGAATELVSSNLAGLGGGNGDSIAPVFSPDGRWLVFRSKASNLTSDPVGSSLFQIFARDMKLQVTRLVSRSGATGQGLPWHSSNAVVSADSRYVFFQFASSVGADTFPIYRHDLLTAGTNRLVCNHCSNPSVCGEGRFVTYEQRSAVSGLRDVMLHDLLLGTLTIISTNGPDLSGRRDAVSPQVSRDGRYVVFASRSTNLVADVINNTKSIFVRDRATGVTLLASRGSAGAGPANGPSMNPVMAPDGRTVLFQSFASDLAGGDYNNTADIYALRLGGPDSDFDGLDDDWEMAYFSALSEDGGGDFDGDGASNRHEFQAGTDPTNTGSILRALTVTGVQGASATVLWNAVPGRSYRVQFKSEATGPAWNDLPGLVTATSATASQVDPSPSGAPRRYYRVALEPR